MKSNSLSNLTFVVLFVGVSLISYSTPSGTLKIIASGTSSTPPYNNWLCGIGVPTQTYTITAADLSTLMSQNAYKLSLNYDTIVISGSVVLDFSSFASDVFLALRTNDYEKGVISFDSNASLQLIAGSNKKSVISLSAGQMLNCLQVKADTIKIMDVNQGYQRIEMNGFKNWIQADIDSLISRASHIGYDIAEKASGGYKVNDFTYNTLFEADSGVFSMTAQQNFLNGAGIGFKNMDRDGTLAGIPLGAFPSDTFYVNLINADGLRFKVNVNGSAEKLSIAISNCATMVFEYYVYDIPFTAVDKDGYMTVPLALFQKEFWSGNWDLTKPIVFIIEIMNITNGTKVSFSDIHAYKLQDKANGFVQLGNIVADGFLEILSTGNVRQEKGTSLFAKNKTRIHANGSIILFNNDNSFCDDVILKANYMYVEMDSNTIIKDSIHFYFNELPNYTISDVVINETSKGALNSYLLPVKTQAKHSVEVVFTSPIISFTITGDKDLCLNEGGILTANGNVDAYNWMYDGELISQMYEIVLPDTFPVGTYRYFLTAERTYNSLHYTLTNSILINVHAPISQHEITSICQNELPYAWRDTIFDTGTITGNYVFNRSTVYGCDSIVDLTLTVYDSYEVIEELQLCETDLPYTWRDTVFETGSHSDTIAFYRTTERGCDSVVSLALTIIPSLPEAIGPMLGDTLIDAGGEYTYSITAVEGVAFYHWVLQDTFPGQNKYITIDTLTIDTFFIIKFPFFDFVISVKAINDCDSSEATTLFVRSVVSVKEANADLLLKIFPNPTDNALQVKSNNIQMNEVLLYDIMGKELKHFIVNATHATFDVSDLQTGMYFLHVKTEKGIITRKIQIIR